MAQASGSPLASARPALSGLHEFAPQRPFGVSSKQTSGVGVSESAGWHHTLLGKPHPFRGKFTQLTANMGYLYPQPQAGPTPTYLLPVGILGMVRYDWVLLAMRWEHLTQQGQDPTILRVQGKRGSVDLRDHGSLRDHGDLRVHKRESYHPAQDSVPTLLTP